MANFSGRISAMAASSPSLIAIELLGSSDAVRQTTYLDLEGQAGRIAAWLQSAGVARGDRAAILADNDAAWIAAYLGVLRLGAVAVPLDTAYKAPQVRTVLADSGARVLFTTERYLDTARRAVEANGSPALPATLVLLAGRSPGVIDVPSLDGHGPAPPVANVDPGAAAVILYTSGTTADPKGVVLTHANLDAERDAALAIVPVGPPDAILGVLPLFHALAQMANLLLPLSIGARVVFLETVSTTSLVSALASRGITVFACVPQFFYLIHQRVMTEVAKKGRLARGLVRSVIRANVWLRDRFGWNPARLFFASVHKRVGPKMRVLITGGSKFDAAIGRDLYGMGFTILNAYGLTETSGGATIQRPGDRFTTSVGQPFGGVEIKIASGVRPGSDPEPQGSDPGLTPDVSDGEVLIRGPIIMRGYFNRPDATGDALKDGWLYTGDLGRLDDKGRLYITGRKKEIIVLASGKNLYPEEIEAHYRQSSFIKELCILGLSRPGEPSAERLHAVVVPDEQALRERGIVNLRELVRFELETLAVQLPAYKRILSYDVSLEPLPRTTTGKIKRREVERLVHERAGQKESAARETTDAEREWLEASGRAEALATIAARLGRERVRPDDNLELDLALDSMERVELLTVLEERQGTRVAPDVRATIFSVRQLVEAVEAAPSAEGSESGGAAELPWAALLATDTNPQLTADLARRRPIAEAALFVGFKILGLLSRVVLRLRVSGLEHLPASGPFLLCPNHQTRWDGLFLGAVLPFRVMRQMFTVAAAEYFETPTMKRVARMFNIVPIDPDANLVTAMQSGASGLRLGKVLMLFPEGERSIDGDVKKFRKGAAILSAHLDAPIVPIAVDGLFDLWPRGRPSNWAGLLPWRVKPVTLVFGPPMRVRAGEYTEGTARLRGDVVALLDEVRKHTKH